MRGPLVRRAIAACGRHGLLLVFSALALLPVYFMVVNAFKTKPEYTGNRIGPPLHPSLASLLDAIGGGDLYVWLLNSCLVTIGSVGLSTALAALAAYPLSLMRWRFGPAILGLLIVLLVVPPIVLVVPLFELVVDLRQLNTFHTIIAIYTGIMMPFSTFLLASFFSFPGATGEVQGTLADLDGDGRAEVVVGSAGQVRVFNLDGSERLRFAPYAGYAGNLALAAGDLDHDGRDEVFTAASNGHVKVFAADQSERFSFLPYAGYSGAVRLASGDVNGDGRDDVLTTAVDGAHVKAFSGVDLTVLDSFFASQGKDGVTLA